MDLLLLLTSSLFSWRRFGIPPSKQTKNLLGSSPPTTGTAGQKPTATSLKVCRAPNTQVLRNTADPWITKLPTMLCSVLSLEAYFGHLTWAFHLKEAIYCNFVVGRYRFKVWSLVKSQSLLLCKWVGCKKSEKKRGWMQHVHTYNKPAGCNFNRIAVHTPTEVQWEPNTASFKPSSKFLPFQQHNSLFLPVHFSPR